MYKISAESVMRSVIKMEHTDKALVTIAQKGNEYMSCEDNDGIHKDYLLCM